MASLIHITAAQLALNYKTRNLSLAAGRGYPGVIYSVENTDGLVWVSWEDGNGGHTSAYDPDDSVAVLA